MLIKIITNDAIKKRIKELAELMYNNRQIILMPIMNGGINFCLDLLDALPETTIFEPIVPCQYYPEPPPRKEVWLVDNTIASGRTLLETTRMITKSKSVVLLDLPCKHLIEPTLVGFKTQHKLVRGYGADTAGSHRNLKDIYATAYNQNTT